MHISLKASTYYHPYTDVAQSFDKPLRKGVNPTNPPRSQRSWSYFKPEDERYDNEYNLRNSEDDFSCYGIPMKPTASSKTFSK